MDGRDDGKEGIYQDSDTVSLWSLGHLALLLCALVSAAVKGESANEATQHGGVGFSDASPTTFALQEIFCLHLIPVLLCLRFPCP